MSPSCFHQKGNYGPLTWFPFDLPLCRQHPDLAVPFLRNLGTHLGSLSGQKSHVRGGSFQRDMLQCSLLQAAFFSPCLFFFFLKQDSSRNTKRPQTLRNLKGLS